MNFSIDWNKATNEEKIICFAEYVAKYVRLPDIAAEFDLNYHLVNAERKNVWQDKNGMVFCALPDWPNSADAVLPWLEKDNLSFSCHLETVENGKPWFAFYSGIEGNGATLPEAAMKALLRAAGVTVID